ncbi:V-type ATPase subunit [Patescibacteria group bacterium]|nr:V-type ATPase subunit [Patescibacteria group bacterium]
MMTKSQYLYATGRIRSLETKLLSTSDMERMIDAKDATMAFKVFNDLSYADELADIEKPEEYQAVLNHDLQQVKDVLKQITPDSRVMDLLFSRYDYHNIKLFLKARILEKDLSKYESNLGNIDPERLRDYIIKDTKTAIPAEIEEVIREAKKEFDKKDVGGYIIDSYIDGKYFARLKELAEKLNNSFTTSLVRNWIDIANVKLFLRAKRLELELEKFQSYFIAGGNILASSLVNYYGKDLKEAVTICSRGFEDAAVKEAIKDYAEGGELWKMEKAFENYEIKFIQQAKYIAYGPEIVLAYYLAKKNAVRNVRLIFTGKLNDLPSGEIKERVREIY